MTVRIYAYGRITIARLSRRANITSSMSLSYAEALSTESKTPSQTLSNNRRDCSTPPQQTTPVTRKSNNSRSNNSSPNPAYRAKTELPESGSYVLTFLTSKPHHDTLTDLRTKYFPPKLNHLDAHLTLFHALPGSKLDDTILPTLHATANSTRKFPILASTPFKLNKGIAIGVPKSVGGDSARAVHSDLKRQWSAFLSDQDAGGFKPHYTIMNKVDDGEDVARAFDEVEKGFKAVRGTVEGLSLWLYEGPSWVWKQDFVFRD